MRDDNINDGGPAFPANSDEWDNDAERYRPCSVGGMSLRDYFAAKALQGLLASGQPLVKMGEDGSCSYLRGRDAIPLLAYEYADAMLKARA